jgi:small-conductance mechanosensitive channel
LLFSPSCAALHRQASPISSLVRLDVNFGVSYEADPHKVSQLAIEAAMGIPRVEADRRQDAVPGAQRRRPSLCDHAAEHRGAAGVSGKRALLSARSEMITLTDKEKRFLKRVDKITYVPWSAKIIAVDVRGKPMRLSRATFSRLKDDGIIIRSSGDLSSDIYVVNPAPVTPEVEEVQEAP